MRNSSVYRMLLMIGFLITGSSACGDHSEPTVGDDNDDKPIQTEFSQIFFSEEFQSINSPSISINKDEIYIIDGTEGFRQYRFDGTTLTRTFIDSSTSTDPWLAVKLAFTEQRIVVQGHRAGQPTLRFYRFSNDSLILESQESIDFVGGGLAMYGNYVFNAHPVSGGITIIDISDIDSPAVIDTIRHEAPIHDLVLSENALYAFSEREILMYSVQESGARLQYEGSFPLSDTGKGGFESDAKLFLTEQNFPKVLSLNNSFSPTVVFEGPEIAYDGSPPLAFGDNYLFIGGSSEILIFAEVNGTFEPYNSITDVNEVADLATLNNWLFVLSEEGLGIYQINP